MTSEKEKLNKLLGVLLKEHPEYSHIAIPDNIEDKRKLLRSLMNIRMPSPLAEDVLHLQDEELAEQREEKGVVTLAMIPPSPLYPKLRLW